MSAAMNLIYRDRPLYVSSFNYELPTLQRDLGQLEAEHLLAGSADALREIGYQFSFGLRPDEDLLSLAAVPFSKSFADCANPVAATFQHCYAESAVLAWTGNDRDVAARNRYLAGELLKKLGVTELPYFCSFASGCAGFVFLCAAAAGILASSNGGEVICAMADSMPDGVTCDLAQERILGSAQSSAFVVGPRPQGFQLLGAAIYSTARSSLPLLELVKRTVEMISGLAKALQLDFRNNNLRIHYPNMFPEAWKMVTRYLRLSDEHHVLRGMAERAHCFGSDSVMTLAELCCGQEGRLHFAVNYGLGLHLGVVALKEVGH